MSQYKKINFRIPEELYRQFYRIFPGRGEQTQFFRQIICIAVDLGPEARFAQQIRREIEEEKEHER
jgi:hypothetical protein